MDIENDLPFVVLKPLYTNYVFPSKRDQFNMSKFFLIGASYRLSAFVLIVIGAVCHFIYIAKRNVEGLNASEDIVVICAGFEIILLLVIATILHKKWKEFFESILDSSIYGKPDDFDENLKQTNFLGSWLLRYYFLGCIAYALISLLEAGNCSKIKEKYNLRNIACYTFVPIWLPFDITNRFYVVMLFTTQFFLTMKSVEPAAMICYIVYQCTQLFLSHIEALKKHFNEIINAKDIEYRPDGIGYWIRYHNHLLKLGEEFRHLVKVTVGHVVLISALVFGCAETQLINGIKPFGALIFFLGWLAVVLLLCHAGETMMNSFLSVHDAVRDSDWYLCSLSVQKKVLLILLRSQKPICLEAVPLGAMNYSLCVMIIKTSYSYMTILNRSV
ncbi:unnamed protein product [Phyllotreta striolata]|uniref:Odorant receptor n=1 Tax=Phyllotreta striolata TaxID=444603 RepID=A0A9N9XJU2_PHYSR|nr:unnamed protein product [Phyllotreta striolata]